MTYINHILLAVLHIACTAACVSHAGDQAEADDAFTVAVRSIHTYSAFTNGHQNARTPSGNPIATRPNYETFVRLAVKDYKTTYTLAEIREIAEFYDSPIGKKFMQHRLESDLFIRFLKTIDPETYPEVDSVWRCPGHPQVKITSSGKCPICMKKLQEKKLRK